MGNKLSFGDTFSITFAIGLALGLLALIFYPTFMSVRADGKVTFCYVTTDTYFVPTTTSVVVFNVWGNREWRGDLLLDRNLPSFDAAAEIAKRYGCLLK